MKKRKKIFVTRPSLPELKEFVTCLEDIWESRWLTNRGKYHQQLEKQMAGFLGVQYVSLFSSGTSALVTALQALEIEGEVITTPYSFVATTHALWWNKILPVFVDIEPEYCNLDPGKIEAAITPKTSAILPVNVYGNPCMFEKIRKIADKHGLKVIYDAAHAFGNRLDGNSILNYGDLSVLSFHATKPFTTMEGGAIVSHDMETKRHVDYLKNFGFANETTVVAPGINSKMNEMQAALGLLQLKNHRKNIRSRKKIAEIYYKELKNLKGISLFKVFPGMEEFNYSYFPIFIDEEKYGKKRDELNDYLKQNNIYARRYFYPLISDFPVYSSLRSSQPGKLSVARKKSEQVICLPVYPELDHDDVKYICALIKNFAL